MLARCARMSAKATICLAWVSIPHLVAHAAQEEAAHERRLHDDLSHGSVGQKAQPKKYTTEGYSESSEAAVDLHWSKHVSRHVTMQDLVDLTAFIGDFLVGWRRAPERIRRRLRGHEFCVTYNTMPHIPKCITLAEAAVP